VPRYGAKRTPVTSAFDGHLEFVTSDGYATGRLAAAQVKSGSSYFDHATAAGWRFYLADRHRRYWESFPLPVLIILHDSATGKSYWTDARQALRVPGNEKAYIEVPEANVLQGTDPVVLFQTAGVIEHAFIDDIPTVLKTLIATNSNEKSFPLSYFDLFVLGLCNISRTIYYGMDVMTNAVEFNLEASDPSVGMGIGEPEHCFAFGFVQFLLAQNLAQIDYADCLIDWHDRKMHPHFVAPLTSRGRALVSLIHTEERRLVAIKKLPDEGPLHVAQEGTLRMNFMYPARFALIRRFQEIMRGEGDEWGRTKDRPK
jgi:Domain of unknown function (DUF4365)